MLQENVDLYAKWIDKLGSGEVTEEGYEDTFEELSSSVYDVNSEKQPDYLVEPITLMCRRGELL